MIRGFSERLLGASRKNVEDDGGTNEKLKGAGRPSLLSHYSLRMKNFQSFVSDVSAGSESDEYSVVSSIVEESDEDNSDAGDDSDLSSVYTTLTVETIRTAENENVKPLAAPNSRSTQIFVGANSPTADLKASLNDVGKLSIYAKEVTISKSVACAFLELVRGDNRSWEAIAVDILRQKARWDSIVLDGCSSSTGPSTSNESAKQDNDEANEKNGDDDDKENDDKGEENKNEDTNITPATPKFLDLVLSGILNVDNCSYLHLTGLEWRSSTAFTMQSIMFSQCLKKLQLDFLDLSKHVPALVAGLSGNKSLTCFIASRCGLDDNHLGCMLRHLPMRLEELRIFGNKCRSKGLASLTRMIKNRRAKLKILDLSFQHIDPGEEFDITNFAEALGNNKSLTILDLDNDSLDDNHLTLIVEALCKNKTLEEIMLNHNKITGEGVAMLAAKFGEMKGLKKISMYSNLFDATSTTV